ncbi:uncharacterized protein LOC102156997 isoform X3 [Canis lupus familiaris]|uniref:uncharacterized protein LOC102156997 isoform X3 n=1 Tax=Canis lupus familiaris TaxID=9615 RepID=UPI000BAA0AD9|nr:uncharacterized protein LOC102156997 isoform X3 [Canis lupus familiaris]XP_038286778.1 uncharacterized protein LOC102156997 isoform X3 [Canis lupus familiaris]XP_038425357.1 uncharacterized protein LOC102156997 isoform X3 [Canis lupus familiaris]|eukprot:XP_022263956.1 uncharacterized protein LOC102156997 isoform X6 [Canis lupus familiaris]
MNFILNNFYQIVLTFRREPILENNLTSLIEHSHNALEHDRRLRFNDRMKTIIEQFPYVAQQFLCCLYFDTATMSPPKVASDLYAWSDDFYLFMTPKLWSRNLWIVIHVENCYIKIFQLY